MPQALVVDDSKVDRLMIGGLLEKEAQIEVSYAATGREALEKLAASLTDLVITDLVMPEMDGLMLVDEIRDRFPLVPVILVTSQGSEEVAVQALKKGAASYVPKRALASELVETVRVVLSSAAQQRHRSELMESMVSNESAWELPNDRRLFGPLVSYLQETMAGLGLLGEAERTRIGVAIEEALVNAAEHGNLEVDSSLRSQDRNAYLALVQERLSESPFKDRRIRLEIRFSPEEARFLIRDHGQGFDPSSLPDPRDPENLLKVSGRGVLIMRTFMDEVHYNDSGNEVILVKKCVPETEASEGD